MTCAAVSSFASNAAHGVGQLLSTAANAVYDGARAVEGYWEEFNHNVQDLTDEYLPWPIAKITQAFIHALPFTLLGLFAPFPITIGVMALYAGFGLIQNIRGDITTQERSNMATNGVGFSQTIKGVMGIGIGIIAKNPVPAIVGGIQLIGAAAAFVRSGLAGNVFG